MADRQAKSCDCDENIEDSHTPNQRKINNPTKP
jgi:hypothetical protein